MSQLQSPRAPARVGREGAVSEPQPWYLTGTDDQPIVPFSELAQISRRELADLRLELVELRRQVAEYQKANLDQGARIHALEQKIIELQADLLARWDEE